MRPAIVFDDGLGKLAPLTDLRPAFEVRTGALTTLQRIVRTLGIEVRALFVPEGLRALTEERHGARVGPGSMAGTPMYVNEGPVGPSADELYLCVSGRCVLPDARLSQILPGSALVESVTGDLIAGCLTVSQLRGFLNERKTPAGVMTAEVRQLVLLSRPWQFRAFRDLALDVDLASLTFEAQDPPPTATVFGTHPCSIHRTAKVYPTVTIDTEGGPVCIDSGALIRPGAIITGPVYIGPGCAVLDRCIVRAHTALGPQCKVSGEVSGCVFQGYANKAHDGHLGDSYIGEWVNLGAGTTNSNLLNTYSEVVARAAPGMPNERTGQTFLGCVLGDHCKFAICTRIMTGAVVHTGTMYAATAPVSGCIGGFSWVTDSGARPYRFDKFSEVASAVMARRNVRPSAAYSERLRALCDASGGGAASAMAGAERAG